MTNEVSAAERPSVGDTGRSRVGDDEPPLDGDEPWTHEQAVVGDVRLHYVEMGDEDDPLAILLHGFPEFWYSWREQIPALADAGYRVVAPDMRGYNRSEKPRGLSSYRMDALVGDVVGLVEHFGREQAHVVGHDWGGGIVWELANRYPGVVETLTVLNAPHPERYRQALRRNPEQWWRSSYAVTFQVPRLPEVALGARNCEGVERMLRETSTPNAFDDRDLRRYREAAGRPGSLTAALNYYRAASRQGLRKEVRALLGRERPSCVIRVPTLLVWGERDPALGVDLTEGLDQWVPDLRVERLPDATHWVQNDAPERVNELLVEFWNRT